MPSARRRPRNSLDADAGASYLFECAGDGTWSERAKLLAPLAAPGDVFGANVALTGLRALVVAVHDDDLGTDAGSVHVFLRAPSGLWSWSEELHASTRSSQDGLGEALAAQGDLALASAPRADGPVLASGAAFLFDLDP